MEYSENDLHAAEAEILMAERRERWMASVVTTLKARNLHTRAAERQAAHFSAMSAAMRRRRQEIEDAIIAQRSK
jgi:hypothetical protein